MPLIGIVGVSSQSQTVQIDPTTTCWTSTTFAHQAILAIRRKVTLRCGRHPACPLHGVTCTKLLCSESGASALVLGALRSVRSARVSRPSYRLLGVSVDASRRLSSFPPPCLPLFYPCQAAFQWRAAEMHTFPSKTLAVATGRAAKLTRSW